MYYTLKFLAFFISGSLLLSGCKKDQLSSAEWGEMATAKRQEIQTLSSNIPCSQKANVTVQLVSSGCSTQYFAILDSDMSEFEKLKKEYINFTDKQYAAWSKEGMIVEPCHESIWAAEQPIRLDCSENKVELITSANVGIPEARALIDGTNQLIADLVNAQVCNNDASWTFTALISHKTMKVEYIPYLRTVDHSVLKEKVSLYNRLTFRVIEAEGTGSNFVHGQPVDKIDCVNGKPVIKFKN